MSDEQSPPAAAATPAAAAKTPATRRSRPSRTASASARALVDVALEPEREDPFQSAKRVWPD